MSELRRGLKIQINKRFAPLEDAAKEAYKERTGYKFAYNFSNSPEGKQLARDKARASQAIANREEQRRSAEQDYRRDNGSLRGFNKTKQAKRLERNERRAEQRVRRSDEAKLFSLRLKEENASRAQPIQPKDGTQQVGGYQVEVVTYDEIFYSALSYGSGADLALMNEFKEAQDTGKRVSVIIQDDINGTTTRANDIHTLTQRTQSLYADLIRAQEQANQGSGDESLAYPLITITVGDGPQDVQIVVRAHI